MKVKNYEYKTITNKAEQEAKGYFYSSIIIMSKNKTTYNYFLQNIPHFFQMIWL